MEGEILKDHVTVRRIPGGILQSGKLYHLPKASDASSSIPHRTLGPVNGRRGKAAATLPMSRFWFPKRPPLVEENQHFTSDGISLYYFQDWKDITVLILYTK